jgi:5-methyltetrahydropteroyltriglutamate--homocysteine methyltransferase
LFFVLYGAASVLFTIYKSISVMITHNLGYPRIGLHRELKKASESFWAGKISESELSDAGKKIRMENWRIQKEAGLHHIPSNDFTFYDQVLDMSFAVGAIPARYKCLQNNLKNDPTEFYFALARGYQKDGFDLPAMEMTKWFDTNYHYIVPEFTENQAFHYISKKAVNEFIEARDAGILTRPVLIGPVSFLLLGKTKEKEFNKLNLLPDLLPVYLDIIYDLVTAGAEWIQIDEPFLAMDIDDADRELFRLAYREVRDEFPDLKILVATYFEGLRENTGTALSLPVDAIHIDLVRAPAELIHILGKLPVKMNLSLGIVDGRNIWKNDFSKSLRLIKTAIDKIGSHRLMIAPSCSLIHSPIDIQAENDESTLPPVVRGWMSFAKQKISEVVSLSLLASRNLGDSSDDPDLMHNEQAVSGKNSSTLIHDQEVRGKLRNFNHEGNARSEFPRRKIKQQNRLNLPIFPSTTIGSFPQTPEVRSWRSKLKKGDLTYEEYTSLIRQEIEKAIRWQEDIGLDVLVHGEFERNDMVEYFGELLKGFAFTKNGWIQSYGSRYVKPPVIYGDVSRERPMTVEWSRFAQSLTQKPVKGMITGPVTILQWSFVRDDQPRSETCFQIAHALREEVLDLENAGISIIQIDEPALREGLPLRKSDWKNYLDWAVKAFRLTYQGVSDETQIHTHMCYSEFHDIIDSITALDADVITIECSRSQMELLDAFSVFRYPNDIGPGVYDIHSPRIPNVQEITGLLLKAAAVIPEGQLWVNPDCGLKTRSWEETRRALENMVKAAALMKEKHAVLMK